VGYDSDRVRCDDSIGIVSHDRDRPIQLFPTKVIEQPIQKWTLIGVKQDTGLFQGDEPRLVDLPGSAMGPGIIRRRTGVAKDTLPALGVNNIAECDQRSGIDPRLFQSLSSSSLLDVGVLTRFTFGNAPRRPTVVRAGRMHQQDLEIIEAASIEECSCGLTHNHPRCGPLSTMLHSAF
jgi:hypothetical protein